MTGGETDREKERGGKAVTKGRDGESDTQEETVSRGRETERPSDRNTNR